MVIAERNGMMVEKSILPPGARWVEYLQSTGTQWIDTGVAVKDNIAIEYDFTPLQRTSGLFYCGCWGNTNTQGRAYLYISGVNTLQYGFGIADAGMYENLPNNISLDRKLYRLDKSGFWINGIRATTMQFSSMAQNTLRFYLMRCNDINNRGANSSKLFGSKIYENGTTIRDFRPIAIGNTGYMMDILTGDYLQYGNKGTGSFIIGPDISAPAIGGGG